MKYAGLNMASLGRTNLTAALNYINEKGPVSRKTMAKALSLTPAAITLMTKPLMESGLLIEAGIDENDRAKVGRKQILLRFNPRYRKVLTVNMEPGRTFVALSDLGGGLIGEKPLSFDEKEDMKEHLKKVVKAGKALLQAGNGYEAVPFGGVSLSVTGAADEKLKVRDYLSKHFNCTVLIENNVRAFTEAELLFDLGKKYDNLLVLKWGPGVGSTITVDKKIYEGRHKAAGEIGHILLHDGRRLEDVISKKALKKGTSIEEAIKMLAHALVNSMQILAPNRVIIYGSIFSDEKIRQDFIDCCGKLHSSCGADRIFYTGLSGKESYIGPLAVYVKSLFEGKTG